MVLVVEQGNPEREELLPSKGDETTVQRIWHSSELSRSDRILMGGKERREGRRNVLDGESTMNKPSG